MHRSLDGLAGEGFDPIVVLSTPDAVNALKVERVPT
jgi:hypothetical protein